MFAGFLIVWALGLTGFQVKDSGCGISGVGWPGPGEKLTERQNSEGKRVSLHEKAGVTERKPGHTMTVLHWKSSVNGLNNKQS